MKLREALERLCALKSHVGREHFKNKYMHDCFCGVNSVLSEGIDEEVIRFIEDAVTEKMNREHG